jgi:trigger factor
MNITQEKVDALNAVVKINIDPADYQPRVDKAIKENAKKAKLTRFSPGNGASITHQKNVR